MAGNSFCFFQKKVSDINRQSTPIVQKLKMSQLIKFYLFLYNSLQTFGCAFALYRILINLLSTKSVHGTYASAGELIGNLVLLEFLEVVHGAIGIVPSGLLLPLMQWGGKTHFMFAIVRQIDEVHELPSVFITFVAWSLIGVVIRYPYYALNCFNICPSFLTYLRYTAFIVLYPIGLAPGEIWLMYKALPFIKSKNLYAEAFASLPFSYYNFVQVVIILYPFLWLKLYLHLFKQRRSKLGKPHKKKKN